MKKTIKGIYDNGTIRFHSTLKLGRKLPLRNRTRLSFTLVLPEKPSIAMASFGMLRIPKRVARLIAESPELSVLNS